MALEKLKCKLQYLLPQHFLSRSLAKLADCRIPMVKNCLIRAFIKHYKVDINTAALTQIDDYVSFNQFFTRALNSAARPIANDQDAIVSPADGTVSQSGKIKDDKLFQAKGFFFSLQELLGGDKQLASCYRGGDFITVYLAPKDYHRVHMPLEAKLLKTIYVPGKLFSVNKQSVENVANLFCLNERLICLFDTEIGQVAIIMVGAMLVAGIETVWGQREVPCSRKEIITKDYADQNIILKKGEEMGRFLFGSTVILLFKANTVCLKSFAESQQITMGLLLGRIIQKGSD